MSVIRGATAASGDCLHAARYRLIAVHQSSHHLQNLYILILSCTHVQRRLATLIAENVGGLSPTLFLFVCADTLKASNLPVLVLSAPFSRFSASSVPQLRTGTQESKAQSSQHQTDMRFSQR
jgi:hypothetical protein